MEKQCVYGYDQLPWMDSKKWRPGKFYPMPVGSTWVEDADITYFDGYCIFELDREAPGTGDLIPLDVPGAPFTLEQAVNICEAINKEPLEGVPR